MGLKDTFNRTGKAVVEELQRAANPDARSVDNHPSAHSSNFSMTTRRGKVDKHFPNEKKLARYWQIYQEVPIIRQPIRSFASEVVSSGYYVDTEDEDLKEELEDWLAHCAIVDGEVGKDFSILLKKAQVQREVKGTSLCEKVSTEDGNELYGFKLVRPETIRAYTKPGQTVLLPPEYDPDSAMENAKTGLMRNLISDQDFYTNEEGETAAYVQLDDAVSQQSDGNYIPFTRNEIIKLTRDSDTGEIFGISRLAAVEDRLNSLLKKLDDLDKSIESMSSPFQLFKFGQAEDPWSPEEISSFMAEHEPSEFEPGMKQGVQGDLSVETVEGTVPPIEQYLEYDLNWIIAEMPMPKYALGGFTSDTNQFVSRSQSARLENQKKEARTEISNEWTPVLKEKAKELGYNPEQVNALVIGEDPSDMGLTEIMNDPNIDEDRVKEIAKEERDGGPSGENTTRPPASTEDRDGGADTVNGDN